MKWNDLPACDGVLRIPPGEGCPGRRVITHGTACAIAKSILVHRQALATLAREGEAASERIHDLLASLTPGVKAQTWKRLLAQDLDAPQAPIPSRPRVGNARDRWAN
jgi:hypothetical protein